MSTNPYEAPQVPPATSPTRPEREQNRDIGIATVQILMGAAFGYAIWAATAPAEAWDANRLYGVCLIGAGFISSLARRRGFYWGAAGIYAGQVIAIHILIPAGGIPIMPAFLSVAIFGVAPALVGSLLGAAFGFVVRWFFGCSSAARTL